MDKPRMNSETISVSFDQSMMTNTTINMGNNINSPLSSFGIHFIDMSTGEEYIPYKKLEASDLIKDLEILEEKLGKNK